MSDYLDNPPKRYRCYGKDDFGDPYDALTTEDADGEWVRFAEMDLYMFEGGQLMAQAYARIRELEAALRESLSLQSHYANLLNMHDGGERIGFASIDAWIARLAKLRSQSSEDSK